MSSPRLGFRLRVGDEHVGLIHRINEPKVFLTNNPERAVTYSTYEAAHRAMTQLQTIFPSIHVQQIHH